MALSMLNKSKRPITNERGTYFTISAIVLLVMFGFAAFGIEVGRWYAIQGELGKAIDGAAFAGAKNVNNPNIADLPAFVENVAQANFPDGLLGTDTPSFTVTETQGKVLVNGSTNSLNTLAKAINTSYATTHVVASGSAKLRKAEIAVVLDVSGSMDGTPISDLRDGATTFVENFEDQEQDNRFALITFASGVQVLYAMDHNYVNPMTTQIMGLGATGGTNAEDALAQAGTLPWTDQSGMPNNEKSKQVVIFFSDGNPTAFRGTFTRRGVEYDAAVPDGSVSLRIPDQQHTAYSAFYAYPSGDGKSYPSPTTCGNPPGMPNDSVKWHIFEDPTYGLDSSVYPPFNGYDDEYCFFFHSDLQPYVTAVARQKALDNAAALKAQGIEIYTIGLGNVDTNYLLSVSSGVDFAYYTADSAELEGIFQEIANILKLVLTS